MKHIQLQELVKRYLRGQLSDTDSEQLFDILQDSKNREYFEQAKTVWGNDPKMNETAWKNWNRLQFKINRAEQTIRKTTTIRTLWVRVFSVAALLLFGLFSGGILTYLLTDHPIKSEDLVFETPRGQKSLVKLPDGSEVWLNAKSRLVYHSFSSKNRKVELKGEAFFRVAHNAGAPFVVKINECEVKVLGTTFNVMAYDEFGRKEITLITGKVNVQLESDEKVLSPGQALVIKDHVALVTDGNPAQASGWVDNKFNFQNIPLSELIKRLENWYDVDITFENLTGKEVNFTGTFKNEETIWQVLDAIKVYTPIEYKKTNLRKIKIAVR